MTHSPTLDHAIKKDAQDYMEYCLRERVSPADAYDAWQEDILERVDSLLPDYGVDLLNLVRECPEFAYMPDGFAPPDNMFDVIIAAAYMYLVDEMAFAVDAYEDMYDELYGEET